MGRQVESAGADVFPAVAGNRHVEIGAVIRDVADKKGRKHGGRGDRRRRRVVVGCDRTEVFPVFQCASGFFIYKQDRTQGRVIKIICGKAEAIGTGADGGIGRRLPSRT